MVFKRYPNGGGEMLLALAVADHAHDDGTHIYPSVNQLAIKTRQSERTVQYQLRKMEESGWLQLVSSEFGGRGNAREYRINPDWIKGAEIAPFKRVQSTTERVQSEAAKGASGDTKGAIHDRKGATAIAPEPSRTVSKATVNRTVIEPPVPEWLPSGSLDDFIKHRNAMKKPMTDQAVKLLIGELEKLRAAGHDPVECLNTAILNGWQKPYAPKQSRHCGTRADQIAKQNEQVFAEFIGGANVIEAEVVNA